MNPFDRKSFLFIFALLIAGSSAQFNSRFVSTVCDGYTEDQCFSLYHDTDPDSCGSIVDFEKINFYSYRTSDTPSTSWSHALAQQASVSKIYSQLTKDYTEQISPYSVQHLGMKLGYDCQSPVGGASRVIHNFLFFNSAYGEAVRTDYEYPYDHEKACNEAFINDYAYWQFKKDHYLGFRAKLEWFGASTFQQVKQSLQKNCLGSVSFPITDDFFKPWILYRNGEYDFDPNRILNYEQATVFGVRQKTPDSVLEFGIHLNSSIEDRLEYLWIEATKIGIPYLIPFIEVAGL